MDIRVSGHQLDTGQALQDHATDRINTIVEKYFNRALAAHVTFGKAPSHAFACDVVLHVMHGLIMKAHGEAHDAHQALDAAADKIDKQLRRYKRRINDRHEQAAHAIREEEAAYTVFAAEEPEAEVESEAPLVIAETRVDIPVASVSDAVMLLDLRHTNALFFKNAGTGRHNMVYRRDDGSIGWVEPS
jgi:ribosomal subunit interface protein